MKKRPPIEKKESDTSENDDGEDVQINFENQKFCPRCGQIIKKTLKKCDSCKEDIFRINPIGKNDGTTIALAKTALNDPDRNVRKEAIEALGDLDNPKVIGVLTYILLNDPSEHLREEAVLKLVERGQEYSIKALEKALKDDNNVVRKVATSGLKEIRKAQSAINSKKKSAPPKRRPTDETRTQLSLASRKVKKRKEVIGSETIGEKLSEKVPWVGFGLRKPKMTFPKVTTRKLSVPMPGKTAGIMIIYAMLFLLQTGIVYLIYKDAQGQALALGAGADGEALFLYPSIHDSFIIEGIVASILIFICSTGFLMLYQASKYLYNRTMAIRILVIGSAMILAAFFFLQFMIAVKTKTIQQILREIAGKI